MSGRAARPSATRSRSWSPPMGSAPASCSASPASARPRCVRAGLIPYLRDHGIVALACEDLTAAGRELRRRAVGVRHPADRRASSRSRSSTRAVANAVAGQQFVFVVDDVDLLCADERVGRRALGPVLARGQPLGRARPVPVRVRERAAARARRARAAHRLAVPAVHALRAAAARAGRGEPDPRSHPVVLGRRRRSGARRRGRAGPRPRRAGAAGGSPDRRAGDARPPDHRRGAALKQARRRRPSSRRRGCTRRAGRPATSARRCGCAPSSRRPARAASRPTRSCARINLDAGFAQQAFGVLEQRGVIVRGDADGATWMLRHEVLTPRRARADRAGARGGAARVRSARLEDREQGRLTLGELRALRSEGIAPATPAELDVVAALEALLPHDRSAAIAAVPIVILIIIWISMRGPRVLRSRRRAPGGDHDRRARRPRRAVELLLAARRLRRRGRGHRPHARDGRARGVEEDRRARPRRAQGRLGRAARPRSWRRSSRGLVDYATTGNEAALETLKKAAKDPEDLAELLAALRPIARGTPAEVALVESALTHAVAGGPARGGRGGGRRRAAPRRRLHRDADQGADLRRSRAAPHRVRVGAQPRRPRARAVRRRRSRRSPTPRRAASCWSRSRSPRPTTAPSAANAIAVLSDAEASAALRERAKTQLRARSRRMPPRRPRRSSRWSRRTARRSRRACSRSSCCASSIRCRRCPSLVEAARAAFASKSAAVRAAALPLYAKVDPVRAGGELATMLEDKKLDKPLRVAAALAWGEVAADQQGGRGARRARSHAQGRGQRRCARPRRPPRARPAASTRSTLYKMAKAESYAVRIGAAQGLAASAESGGNVGVAVGGIAQLWREKGRPRRDAARIFARPREEEAAARDRVPARRRRARPRIRRCTRSASRACATPRSPAAPTARARARAVDRRSVRRRPPARDGVRRRRSGSGEERRAIAAKLVRDPNSEIRADAARVLAMSAAKGSKVADAIGEALVALLDDPTATCASIAIRAIGGLGAEAPKTAQAGDGEDVRARRRGREARAAAHARKQIGAARADRHRGRRCVAARARRGRRRGARLGHARRRDAVGRARRLRSAGPQGRARAARRAEGQARARRARSHARARGPRSQPRAQPARADHDRARRPQGRRRRAAARARSRRAPSASVRRPPPRRSASSIATRRSRVQLLEPLLDDPSHDVRVAMLPALAAAYAKTNEPEKLAGILRDSETQRDAPPRRRPPRSSRSRAPTPAATASEAMLGKVAKDGARRWRARSRSSSAA